jgi:hypothetical protein
MVRRAEPERVWIWAATSIDAEVRAEVSLVGPTGLGPLGTGAGRSVRLGPRLWVHLVAVEPDAGAFPTDQLLAYDLELVDGGDSRRLDDLGLLDGPTSLAYGDLRLPSFFLRGRDTPQLRLLHGSCRLLHGLGADAFPAADDLLSATARNTRERPSALFLTGDQIYGDDVAGPLIGRLTELGATLLGAEDDGSVPGVPSLSRIPIYGRQQLVEEQACFSSDKADNHLLSLGEFAAAYVVSWNAATWPDRFAPAAEAVPDSVATGRELGRLRHRYDAEIDCLEVARRALPAVRRVLANVPLYTVFDDHDVTDDWNLTAEWHGNVERSPTGRRVVANALAAFWAFQGWGNQPPQFDDDFVTAVSAGPGESPDQGESFDQTLWSFDRWSFTVPTDPPTVVLDTRTQRTWDSERGAPRLVGPHELRRLRTLFDELPEPGPGPVILVSAVPMFGLELQERRQKFLANKLGPYSIDFEAWHSDLCGLVEFMELVIDDLGLRDCVVLSGDVHYGMTIEASFSIEDRRLRVAQLVSSSFKHSGTLAKSALHLLGRVVQAEHERLGWDHRPAMDSAGVTRRLTSRPVNTDDWGDGPVFLSPAVARRAGVTEAPRYRETRRYLAPRERPSSYIVGDANVGLVTIDDGRVEHRLLARGPDGSARAYTSALSRKDQAPATTS